MLCLSSYVLFCALIPKCFMLPLYLKLPLSLKIPSYFKPLLYPRFFRAFASFVPCHIILSIGFLCNKPAAPVVRIDVYLIQSTLAVGQARIELLRVSHHWSAVVSAADASEPYQKLLQYTLCTVQ